MTAQDNISGNLLLVKDMVLNKMAILDGERVSAYVINPELHKYIGNFRSPNQPDPKYIDKETGKIKYASVIRCTCNRYLWTVEATFNHWQMGHFDEPKYVTIKD